MATYEYDTMPAHIDRQTAADYRRDWLEAHGYLQAPPTPPGTVICGYCDRVGVIPGEACPVCGREADRG